MVPDATDVKYATFLSANDPPATVRVSRSPATIFVGVATTVAAVPPS